MSESVLPHDVAIRAVTSETLPDDISSGRMLLHPDIVAISLAFREEQGRIRDYFVAESADGEPYGQVTVRWLRWASPELQVRLGAAKDEVVPNIGNIAVRESYRRQGIARALMSRVYQEAVDRTHRRVYANVAVGNVVARRFFLSEGFVPTGYKRGGVEYSHDQHGVFGEPQEKLQESFYKLL